MAGASVARKERKSLFFICIFCFFFSIFAFFASGHYGGDGLENYLTAESMVLDGDIAIHDRPFGVDEMKYRVRGKTDREGKYYSPHGIGMPILLVPFYAAGELISKAAPNIPHDYITQFCVSLANPLITALIALVLSIILVKLGFGFRTSFLATVAFGLCTMALVYARSGFSEPALCLFILLAFLSLCRYEETPLSRYILISSALLGYALLIKNSSLLYIPLFFAYIVYKSLGSNPVRRLPKLWASAVIPLGIFVFSFLLSRSLAAGSIALAGKATIGTIAHEGFKYGCRLPKAFFYYLLSPGKGYFLYNIPLILSVFGIKGLLNRRKKISVYILSFVAINLLFYSYHFFRGSLFSWGPRYLYLTVPFMCIFLAEFIEEAKAIAGKTLLTLSCVFGFLIQLPCLFVSFSKYLFFVKEKLGLQEYLINFIPDLSPIGGAWHLFISAIKRTFEGNSSMFHYGPDYKFVKEISASLQNYDVWDIWWLNVSKVSPGLSFPVIAVCILLVSAAILSFMKLRAICND